MTSALLILIGLVPVWAAAPQVDILSKHSTHAVFEGVRHLPCMHKTSLCPDKCGHTKDVAVFRVTGYIAYEKTNPHHGDPQAAQFMMPLVEGNEVDAKVLAFAKELKTGDAVRLDWNHEYVKDDGAHYPRRRVTLLSR
jgi:hypothetical protein